MSARDIERHIVVWRGITLAIGFERNWLSSERPVTAHLEIRVLSPEGQPIPMTETGYKSHFCAPHLVDDAGGPAAFVLGWLEVGATSPLWKAADAARRQLSLF